MSGGAAPLSRMVRAARRVRTAALAIALVAAGAGCSKKPSLPIEPIGGDFTLTDHNGQERTLADFKGKVVTIFFGYTQCPDVCPTALSGMSTVMQELGPDAERVQVLFVTVDPERDTPELLAQYVPVFDARFLGLYGTPEKIAELAKEFRVFYRKSGDLAGHYTIDHTAGTYVFGPDGRPRLYVRHAEDPQVVVADIKALLAGK